MLAYVLNKETVHKYYERATWPCACIFTFCKGFSKLDWLFLSTGVSTLLEDNCCKKENLFYEEDYKVKCMTLFLDIPRYSNDEFWISNAILFIFCFFPMYCFWKSVNDALIWQKMIMFAARIFFVCLLKLTIKQIMQTGTNIMYEKKNWNIFRRREKRVYKNKWLQRVEVAQKQMQFIQILISSSQKFEIIMNMNSRIL